MDLHDPPPEFVTKEEFDWAVQEAEEKKQIDFSRTEFFTYNEGLCVQCMHIGSYDDEPAHSGRWRPFSLKTDTSRISPENACTMKSI